MAAANPLGDALVVRPYRSSDEGAVLEMYDRCMGRARPAAEMRWQLEGSPVGPAERWVAETRERVVGFTAQIRLPTWLGGERTVTGVGSHLMVLPEWQGKGVTHRLVHALRTGEHDYEGLVSFPLDASQPVVERIFPETHLLGRMRQWVRWHTPEALETSRGRRLSPRARAAARLALAGPKAIAAAPTPGIEVADGVPEARELDGLARESAGFANFVRVRDAAYVRWRWLDHPRAWSACAARGHDGRLHGFAVYARSTGLGAGGAGWSISSLMTPVRHEPCWCTRRVRCATTNASSWSSISWTPARGRAVPHALRGSSLARLARV